MQIPLAKHDDSVKHHNRVSLEVLAPLRRTVLMDKVLGNILDALPDSALVLNQERQIVAVNKALLRTCGLSSDEALVGKRPGEAIHCLFSGDGPDGCGTGIHCTVCGAFRSFLESQQLNAPSTSESHLTLHDGTALDLEVTSTPIVIDNLTLTLCILKDVSAQKRHQVLEKVFFHDVMNTVGSIRHIVAMLGDDHVKPETKTHYRQLIAELSEKLVEEIAHQRRLVAAEQGEFRPSPGIVPVASLMAELHRFYSSHDLAEGRNLILGEVADCVILSDNALVRRILGNLIKNALEAAVRGGTVTMKCRESSDTVTFAVHNEGVIPQEVQLQLFQRSFSTKGGEGRGIGTYSIKLFGEKYLQGKVSFKSSEREGTTFLLTLPKRMQDRSSRSVEASN